MQHDPSGPHYLSIKRNICVSEDTPTKETFYSNAIELVEFDEADELDLVRSLGRLLSFR
jgi:hypothetical protein